MKLTSPLLLACLAMALPGAQSQLRGRKKHHVDQRKVHAFGNADMKMRLLTLEPDSDSVEDGFEFVEGKGSDGVAATTVKSAGSKGSKGGGIDSGAVAAGSTSGNGKGASIDQPDAGDTVDSTTDNEGKGGCSGGGASPVEESIPEPTPEPTPEPSPEPTPDPTCDHSGVEPAEPSPTPPPTSTCGNGQLDTGEQCDITCEKPNHGCSEGYTCEECICMAAPTPPPSSDPTPAPVGAAEPAPTDLPTDSPTAAPTPSPTGSPTDTPTGAPTPSPTGSPTETPTETPTASPTDTPTGAPASSPTASPTETPTEAPTPSPTASPTETPTEAPTPSPTASPTETPTGPEVEPGEGEPTPAHTDCPTPKPASESLPAPTPSPTPKPAPQPKPSAAPVGATQPEPTPEPFCGDNEVTGDEECDGTADDECKNHEFCNNNCKCEKYCGNGALDDDEECDKTAEISNHGCDANYECTSKCECKVIPTPSPTPLPVDVTITEPPTPEPFCGDGTIDTDTEDCDPEAFLVPNYGCEPNYECTSDCECKALPTTSPTLSPVAVTIPEPTTPPTPTCGNGLKEEEEVCDESAEPTGCLDGYYCVDGCGGCEPYCGNAQIETGEECDFNMPTDENGCREGFYCTTTCTCLPIVTPSPTSAPVAETIPEPVCGDGIKDIGEECDKNSADCEQGFFCTAECTCASLCENGDMDDDEECDPTASDNPGCGTGLYCKSCMCEPMCGNFEMDDDEQCDSSAPDSPDCDAGFYCVECSCVPFCGNGQMDGDEECDSSAPDGGCPDGSYCNGCVCEPYCGNNFIDDGEECDGTAGSCDGGAECTSECVCGPYCGNGMIDGGEECDGAPCGGGAACTSDCLCETDSGTIPDNETICINYTLNFDFDINGNPVPTGVFVDDSMWAGLLTMSASGGLGDKPMLFDTANPGTHEAGDPDLGAPNEACPGGGPGVGIGGQPGQPGENCEPLGNVLIIQEDNGVPDIPDDEAAGGDITITFDYPIPHVYELGMMDIEPLHPPTTLFATYLVDGTEVTDSFPIEGTGNNGVQSIPIFRENVTELRVNFGTSGAIDWFTFCF